MYAKGGDDGPELERAHQIAGAWELTKWVHQSAALGRHVIVVCIVQHELRQPCADLISRFFLQGWRS